MPMWIKVGFGDNSCNTHDSDRGAVAAADRTVRRPNIGSKYVCRRNVIGGILKGVRKSEMLPAAFKTTL